MNRISFRCTDVVGIGTQQGIHPVLYCTTIQIHDRQHDIFFVMWCEMLIYGHQCYSSSWNDKKKNITGTSLFFSIFFALYEKLDNLALDWKLNFLHIIRKVLADTCLQILSFLGDVEKWPTKITANTWIRRILTKKWMNQDFKECVDEYLANRASNFRSWLETVSDAWRRLHMLFRNRSTSKLPCSTSIGNIVF